VAEYYPVESTHPTEDGGLRVQLRYTDAAWLVRLARGHTGDYPGRPAR